jgi:hypothetical protein
MNTKLGLLGSPSGVAMLSLLYLMSIATGARENEVVDHKPI